MGGVDRADRAGHSFIPCPIRGDRRGMSAPSERAVLIRPARPDDASGIARHVVMAGGGIYEFLLDGLFEDGLSAADLLVPGITARTGAFSHTRCLVADVAGVVIGVAHAHPADLSDDDRDWVPADRLAHLAPFDRAQDPGSCFLSALAVDPHWRRRGIGARLLDAITERARIEGHDRLTLHVWADNAIARRLYLARGFEVLDVAAVPAHPRLPREGGSLLMRKRI